MHEGIERSYAADRWGQSHFDESGQEGQIFGTGSVFRGKVTWQI